MSDQATAILFLILFFGGLVLLIVLLFRYVKKVNKKKTMAYAALALELDCSHSHHKRLAQQLNRLEGNRQDIPLVIYEKVVGSGKNQVLYLMTTFSPSPFPFEFTIGKEGFFHKIGKVMGMNDIQFGDEEFDKKFRLKSKSEDQFRSLLNYKLQQALALIGDDLRGNIESKNGEFTYTIVGGVAKEKQFDSLKRVLNFMEEMIREQKR